MKYINLSFIGLLLVAVHIHANTIQELLSKSTLIVDRPTLDNIERKSNSIKGYIKEIKQELTKTDPKANVEWIDTLHQLFTKNDLFIEKLRKAVLIDLDFDSVEIICRDYLGGKYISLFVDLFDKISQFRVPIDTLNLIVFEYFEQLLEPNKEVLENKRAQKVRLENLGGQSLSKIIKSLRDYSKVKFEHSVIKKLIEKATSTSSKPNNAIQRFSEHLLVDLNPLRTQIAEIKKMLSVPKNIKDDGILKKKINDAIALIRKDEFLNQVSATIKQIYSNIEAVVTSHETLLEKINEDVPYESKFIRKTFVTNWARLQRVITRLYTKANDMTAFANDYTPSGPFVPNFIHFFRNWTTKTSTIYEVFECDYVLITKKTLNRLQMLANTDPSMKKDCAGAIAAMTEYLSYFPNLTINLDIDGDKSFYSHMYDTQFFMPYRENIEKSLKRTSINSFGLNVKSMDIFMGTAINHLRSQIDHMKTSLEKYRNLARDVSVKLVDWETLLKTESNVSAERQNKIRKILESINQLISPRLSEIKAKGIDKIKNNLKSINDFIDNITAPEMNGALKVLRDYVFHNIDKPKKRKI